jgi:prepilin-type processing-associated H-X9-DG protein
VTDVSKEEQPLRHRRTSSVIVLLWIFVIALFAVVVFQFSSHFGDPMTKSSCPAQMKQLGIAMLMYTQDYGGWLPDPNRWSDELYEYLDNWNLFTCPEAREKEYETRPTYAMNRQLRGLKDTEMKDASGTVAIFESGPKRNLSGGAGLVVKPGRHNGGNNFMFVDGHVKYYKDGDISKMIWNPELRKQ